MTVSFTVAVPPFAAVHPPAGGVAVQPLLGVGQTTWPLNIQHNVWSYTQLVTAKVALMSWSAVTVLKLYAAEGEIQTRLLIAEEPSTVTVDMEYPEFGVMVKVLFAPLLTVTEPEGEIEPPGPAEASMVCVWRYVPLKLNV